MSDNLDSGFNGIEGSIFCLEWLIFIEILFEIHVISSNHAEIKKCQFSHKRNMKEIAQARLGKIYQSIFVYRLNKNFRARNSIM